jgi:cytochrome c
MMFCNHCHGPKGAGGGSITHPIYSAIPHYNDTKQIRRSGATMSELTSGHLFHAITYGLNAMGPHASQITEDERWKIVLYVQELQKKSD